VNGDIGYVKQVPWIESKSIRENILFNSVYDREKYRKVVKLCQLRSDFDLFEFGDETMVGEKGINLSGG
jgi:ABC-type multidrug transport system fused ATPase/permease subunit